ncbi:Sec-independent protein translocase protein TatB [Chloroflexota bacterium]
MGFFDMGMGEILLVIVVALIIWGPGKMPEIARTLGKTIRTLRKTSFDLTAEIRKELEKEEIDSPSQPRINGGIKAEESQDTGTPEADNTEQASPKD